MDIKHVHMISHLEICRLLVKYGSQINQPNKRGVTPIMAAVGNGPIGHSECILNLLLENEADVFVQDKNG